MYIPYRSKVNYWYMVCSCENDSDIERSYSHTYVDLYIRSLCILNTVYIILPEC